jgi:hypothetical protein
LEGELNVSTDKLNLVIKNLSYLNESLSNREIANFTNQLQDFAKYYVELEEIWSIVDWKYAFDIHNNQLLIFSKKMSLLKGIDIAEIKNIKDTLDEFITEKSRNDYKRNFVKTANRIKREIQVLIPNLDFVRLLLELQKEIASSLTKSLEIQWDELISKSHPTPADTVLLAFILRLSIENSLKTHPIIASSRPPIKMVGNLFKKLQENRIFVADKNDIDLNKKPLDEVIHGEGVLNRTKLIEIKNYFKTLLATQHLNLF